MAPDLNSMHYARVGVIIGRKNSSRHGFFNVFIEWFFIFFLLLMQIGERFHKCHQVLTQIQVQIQIQGPG